MKWIISFIFFGYMLYRLSRDVFGIRRCQSCKMWGRHYFYRCQSCMNLEMVCYEIEDRRPEWR